MSNSLRPHGLQHTRPPCPSPTHRVYSNSCSLSRWCHPTISSSVVPFSSCPQYFPASGSFPMSELFAWGGQSIGVSATASVLPMNTRDWSPLGWTGWISLQIVAYRALNDTGTSGYTFSTELPWINSLLGQSRFTRVRWKFPAYPFSGGGLTRVHDCGTRPCTHLTR